MTKEQSDKLWKIAKHIVQRYKETTEASGLIHDSTNWSELEGEWYDYLALEIYNFDYDEEIKNYD